MRAYAFIATSAVVAAILVVACGDDDKANGGTTPPATNGDSGPTVTPPGTDAQAPDGGCTFAGYVIDLVQNHTKPGEAPTSDLGDQCTPSTAQSDFDPLFK